MAVSLLNALRDGSADAGIRAVILTGAGGAFCAAGRDASAARGAPRWAMG
jgi:enoyl-CoA hydratase/carnithine racemase